MKITRSAKRLFSGLLLLLPGTVLADNHEFSIVVIPDTQLYAESYPAIIEAQLQWIVDNQATENIIYVAQLGDLKDDLSCDNKLIAAATGGSRTEWQIVDQAFALLESATSAAQPDGIPFGTVAGNHDFEPFGGGCPTDWDNPAQRILNNPTTGLAYDNLFGPARFSGRAYYGGSRVAGSNEDNFTLFESNGIKFIAINLGYHEGQNLPRADGEDPSPEQTWANNLLQTYPDRLGIITSHYFMRCNIVSGAPGSGSCNSTGSQNSIGSYGAQVYQSLKDNPNLFMMLGAHKRGEAYRLETRSGMQPVHVMLANYQSMSYPTGDPAQAATFQNLQPANFGYGDSGFMRIMRFDIDSGTVDIEAFSPPVPETPAVAGTVSVSTCQSGLYQAGDTCSTPAISARSFLPSVFTPANPGANNTLHTGTASNMTGIDFTGYAAAVTAPVVQRVPRPSNGLNIPPEEQVPPGAQVPGAETTYPENLDKQKVTCLASIEDPPLSSDTCPIVVFNGITYWAFSYFDNRVAMNIVGYDEAGNIVQQTNKNGVRYIYDISIDTTNQVVTFTGQAGNTATMTYSSTSQLLIP
jgi:hypothetical protein